METTTATPASDVTPERPEFAVVLGLLPPYSLDDVKRAYLEKVKHVHPDHGGDRDAFDKVQHAYEQANQYLRFRADRRQWIAARMEEYLEVVSVVERLDALGAEVETTMADWVKRSFGEFASLTETIVGVRLNDSQNVDQLVDLLVSERAILPALKWLDLAGCPVTDAHVFQLRVYRQLTDLDLSRSKITQQALAILDWMPSLLTFQIDGTSVGWWARYRLARMLRRRRLKQTDPILHPVNIR